MENDQMQQIQTVVDGALASMKVELKAFQEESKSATEELRKALTDQIEERAKKGYDSPELKEKIEKISKAQDAIEAKFSNPNFGIKMETAEHKTLASMLIENPAFVEWKNSDWRTANSKRIPIDGDIWRKSITNTAVGVGTPGVLMPSEVPGVFQLPKRALTIRDLLRVQPTSNPTVMWRKQATSTNAAYPQTETEAKAESGITYTTGTAAVTTLAHFMSVSRQALDDMTWLRADIENELMYGLKKKEEDEILSGDGLGLHLNGIRNQATAYAGTYNLAGDTALDKLRHAILEIRLREFPVDGIVLNPKDVHDIELVKDAASNVGKYVVGDPKSGTEVLTVWGKPVVETTAIPPGYFLGGAFKLGAILFDRMQAVIDMAFQDSDDFVKNMVKIRCEERLALGVVYGGAFCKGAF